MDHCAADVAAVVEALDLRNVIHIGHSTGGGEVARYVARAEPGLVSKAFDRCGAADHGEEPDLSEWIAD